MKASHRNALKPGHRLLWYRIDRILGQGGFGITYLGTDTNLDQKVAIKEYLPMELAVREGDHSVHPASQAQEDGFSWGLDRFLSEARTLAKFDHPGIVRVLSVFEENNTAYMVMRYEEGRSLQDIIKGQQLSERQLLEITGALLRGLATVHEAGFIHRDIKPANIYIREDGTPVLLDFGSARQSVGAQTQTLTSLVSPGFAPFEQYYAKSSQQGPWTDLYGLGATLYRAVTGEPPADALARGEALLKKEPDALQPIASLAAPGYSTAFLSAIDKALRFAVDERPQNAQEWQSDFEVADSGAAVGPPTAPTLAPMTVFDESAVPTERPDSETDSAYRSFIGPRMTDYYLARFSEFDDRRPWRRTNWHWPAALFTFVWLLYRRMPAWAFLGYPAALAGTAAVASFVLALVTANSLPKPAYGLVFFATALLLPGFFATAVYHARATRLLNQAQKKGRGGAGPNTWLAAKGGVSKVAPVVGVAILIVAPLVLKTLHNSRQLPVQPEAPLTQQEPESAIEPVLPGVSEPEAEPANEAQPARDLMAEGLAAARQDLAEGRLTTPPGNNAAAKYREVLQLDPDNTRARSGLRSIVKSYLDGAKSAAAAGRHGQALDGLKMARTVAPRAEELTSTLVRASKRLGALARQSRDRHAAMQYLNFALKLAPDDPDLLRFRHRLQKAASSRRD